MAGSVSNYGVVLYYFTMYPNFFHEYKKKLKKREFLVIQKVSNSTRLSSAPRDSFALENQLEMVKKLRFAARLSDGLYKLRIEKEMIGSHSGKEMGHWNGEREKKKNFGHSLFS